MLISFVHLECFLRIVFDISINKLKTSVVSHIQQPSGQAFAYMRGFLWYIINNCRTMQLFAKLRHRIYNLSISNEKCAY